MRPNSKRKRRKRPRPTPEQVAKRLLREVSPFVEAGG